MQKTDDSHRRTTTERFTFDLEPDRCAMRFCSNDAATTVVGHPRFGDAPACRFHSRHMKRAADQAIPRLSYRFVDAVPPEVTGGV